MARAATGNSGNSGAPQAQPSALSHEDHAGHELHHLMEPMSAAPAAETAFSGLPWVSGTAALPYAIRFQNSGDSELPAQSVTVTQQLDADLDWQSFQLTEFRFLDQIINVPEGRSYYYERVDLRSRYGVLVDVEGGIDITTGIVTWTLQTIDPATGIAPADKRIGIFTPASDVMGLADPGQAQVGYTFRAQAGVVSGTVIDTQALVAFDTKEPVLTALDQVQVDGLTPTSSVSLLPATTTDTDFMVSWSGADDPGGMGLADYTIYVSDNGGPVLPWQRDSTATSAPFTGEMGHTYAFYSIARDNIGNVEATPDMADAVILVVQPDVTPPASSVSPLSQRQSTLDFQVAVSGFDAGLDASGVNSYDIYVATDGGSFTLWQTLPASNPVAVFMGTSNHTYAFHSVAHDNAGNVEVKSANLIEASTYVPDLTPPDTQVVSAAPDAAGTFTVQVTGSDVGGSGLSAFDIFVQIDGGTPQAIAHLGAGTATAGIYSVQMTYQGLADGTSHAYRFYSAGIDRAGNAEAAPTAPADVLLSATFATPIALEVTSFSVQHGLVGRSFIRYVDVTLNQAGSALSILDTSHVQLLQYSLDGQTLLGSVNLTDKIRLIDHVMELDFGSLGLGGSPNSTVADGYYKLLLDLDGSGFTTELDFYRLLGDVNGDRAVDSLDLSAITSALGQSGSSLDTDVNGNGLVNALDRTLASRSLGRRLAAGLPLY